MKLETEETWLFYCKKGNKEILYSYNFRSFSKWNSTFTQNDKLQSRGALK